MSGTALLSLRQVRVRRGDVTVLDGIDLTLEPGERLALVGPNGAGKTTLLRAIVGLEPLAGGHIVAFGAALRNARDFHAARLRAGLLFQDPDDQLFCPTVLDDVAFGPLNQGLRPGAALEAAHECLEQLDLAHLAGRVTHRLSGGEKRLVSLAAVLAMKPRVLLLDEPTNALDRDNHARMLEVLARQEAAMILVSHDRAALERLATRAVMLRAGRLVPAVIHRHAVTREEFHVHGRDPIHPHGDGADESGMRENED